MKFTKNKKLIASVVALIVAMVIAITVYANKGWFDFNYNYNWVQIAMPDGSVLEGHVEKWWDYEDGDQLQVQIDGNVYLTHATNMVLMYRKDK